MTQLPNSSKPVVKLVYSPESRDDALLSHKSIWSCTAPVAIVNLVCLVLSISLLSQLNFLGGIFAVLAFLMTSVILYFAVPAEIKSRQHESFTGLRDKIMQLVISEANVGSVSAKQVDQLLAGTTIKVKNFNFQPFERHGLAGISVLRLPEPERKLTNEEEYARIRKEYPEAEIIT